VFSIANERRHCTLNTYSTWVRVGFVVGVVVLAFLICVRIVAANKEPPLPPATHVGPPEFIWTDHPYLIRELDDRVATRRQPPNPAIQTR
jgi:heme/copper-type cytochrome/quinol oxidase subunit 2